MRRGVARRHNNVTFLRASSASVWSNPIARDRGRVIHFASSDDKHALSPGEAGNRDTVLDKFPPILLAKEALCCTSAYKSVDALCIVALKMAVSTKIEYAD